MTESYKIYHNPRCSKSRQALSILEEKGKDFEVIEYLKNTRDYNEIKGIIDKLGIEVHDLLRKKESIYKELNIKDHILDNDKVIKYMVENPILIERPIVVKGDEAVICRPVENIEKLL